VSADRFQFHSLLRSYAHELAISELDVTFQMAVHRRTLTWYLYAAESAQKKIVGFDAFDVNDTSPPDSSIPEFETYGAALQWYRDEKVNLANAVRAASENGFHTIAWKLAVVLGGIYMHQNVFEDWILTGRIGVASAEVDQDPVGRAESNTNLGRAYLQSGLLAEAETSHGVALRIRRQLGDRMGEGVSLNALGLVNLRNRDLDHAVANFQQALRIFVELGDERWSSLLQANLAEALIENRSLEEAESLLVSAVGVLRGLGDRGGEGNALFLLSRLRSENGDIAGAESTILDAVTIADEGDNVMWKAFWQVQYGEVLRMSGRFDEALRQCQEAAAVQRRLGDRGRHAMAVEASGYVYRDSGDTGAALDAFQFAEAAFRELDHRWRRAVVLCAVGDVLNATGDADGARARWNEALTLLEAFGDRRSAEIRARLDHGTRQG
jgi:tetratricopeptide (TPR) repeat protein